MTQQQSPDLSYDQAHLEELRQKVALSNIQLLELAYDEAKFIQKLSQLNHEGCNYLDREMFHDATIYLTEAQKILEYVASCGKTIERNFIITILNNEACLYQSTWELDKSSSYIQAIIYNLTSFLENTQKKQIKPSLTKPNSQSRAQFTIYISRKCSLAKYYLQFCAVSSQNKKHDLAFSSATKALRLFHEIAHEFAAYEALLGGKQDSIYAWFSQECKEIKQSNVEEYRKEAISLLAKHIQRTKDHHQNEEFSTEITPYSLGHLMQINTQEIDKNDETDIESELTVIGKMLRTIHFSMTYFTMATELRYLSAQKNTLDESRKNNPEFKESQAYHLVSLIVVVKYLPCESNYLSHILNSFKIHYGVDLIKECLKTIQSTEVVISSKVIEHKEQSNIYEKSEHQELEAEESLEFNLKCKSVIKKTVNDQQQLEREPREQKQPREPREPRNRMGKVKAAKSQSQWNHTTQETTKSSNKDFYRRSSSKSVKNHKSQTMNSFNLKKVKNKSSSRKDLTCETSRKKCAEIKDAKPKSVHNDYQSRSRSKMRNLKPLVTIDGRKKKVTYDNDYEINAKYPLLKKKSKSNKAGKPRQKSKSMKTGELKGLKKVKSKPELTLSMKAVKLKMSSNSTKHTPRAKGR